VSRDVGGSNVPGTVVYQTPQGLVYATPTKGVDSLSEGGYILNLPQTPTLTEPKSESYFNELFLG